MAQDCYKLFKTVYNQAIADSLSSSVALAAAQAAMQNCLNQQAIQSTAASPIVSIPGDMNNDPGPSTKPRGTDLGIRKKG